MNYDEPLTENPLFQLIHNSFPDLLNRVIEEGWVICVPRSATIKASALISEDVFDHILIPTGLEFRTLSKKLAVIHGDKTISLEEEKPDVKILFSETFYIGRGRKYKVVCIERPLNRESSLKPHRYEVTNLQDCIQLISDGGFAISDINKVIMDWPLRGSTLQTDTLQVLRELTCSLYNKCLDMLSCDNGLLSEETKFALETYLQHSVHYMIFPAICNCTSQTDAHFNKIVRNMEVMSSSNEITTCAKIELNGINHWTTVLGKLQCLRSVFKSSNFVTTDDLLHTFVTFILKTSVSNWIANLSYITQFRFSTLSLCDENAFLITTLEAAIKYIKTGNVCLRKPLPPVSQDSNIKSLFENIVVGNLDLIKQSLNSEIKNTLCHPLCSCDVCIKITTASSLGAINSSDENGCTPLHIACIHGKPHVVEYLLNEGSNPNVTDHTGATPLHYAALHGHQNALLLLLHSDAYVRIPDYNCNTVLHVAVNNGHENCVKALLYFLEQKGDYLDINSRNNFGNTPLHLASRWGYMSIVRILLQYGANSCAVNKHNQTPLHVAHSCYMADLLRTSSTEMPYSVLNHNSPKQKNIIHHSSTANRSDMKPSARSKSLEQEKRIELLLKAIENNDLPLTCYYLGIPGSPTPPPKLFTPPTSCHPLCSCKTCIQQFEKQESSSPLLPLHSSEILPINSCNREGYTALHIAAKYGHVDILRLLLDAGAAVNARSIKNGYNPIHLACKYGKISIVHELLKCGGCDTDPKDVEDNTPLHLGCFNNYARIVETLLAWGVDTNVKNCLGKTALQYAKDNALTDIVNLFRL